MKSNAINSSKDIIVKLVVPGSTGIFGFGTSTGRVESVGAKEFYYHFLTESVLGLYKMLEKKSILSSLDCRLWYQGNYGEVVQMFSRHPIVALPVTEPFFRDASAIDSDIKTLKYVGTHKKEDFYNLKPMVQFLSDRIHLV